MQRALIFFLLTSVVWGKHNPGQQRTRFIGSVQLYIEELELDKQTILVGTLDHDTEVKYEPVGVSLQELWQEIKSQHDFVQDTQPFQKTHPGSIDAVRYRPRLNESDDTCHSGPSPHLLLFRGYIEAHVDMAEPCGFKGDIKHVAFDVVKNRVLRWFGKRNAVTSTTWLTKHFEQWQRQHAVIKETSNGSTSVFLSR